MNYIDSIQKTKKIIRALDGDIESLVGFGFQRVFPCACSCGLIYINKKLKVVVKRPFISNLKNIKRLPKYAIPTSVIYSPLPLSKKLSLYHTRSKIDYNYIFIQPLAKVDYASREKAFDRLCELRGFDKYDVHEYNCGFFENKPVIIDW